MNRKVWKQLTALAGAAVMALPFTAFAEENSHYPVTISNFNSAKEQVDVTFEKCPERVFAINQGNIETLLALGLSDKIVGAVGLDNEVKEEYAEDFAKINYLTDFDSAQEIIVSLEPDLILGWWSTFREDGSVGTTDFWNERDVNTFMVKNSNSLVKNRTLENEYEYILDIGNIFDVEDKAQEIVDGLKAQVESIQKATEGREPRKAMIVEDFGEGEYWVYDKTLLAGDMATTLGADLVEAATEDGMCGKEDLINLNPDVMFVVHYGDENDEETVQAALDIFLKDEGLQSITAIQNGDVYGMPLADMYASAMRTGDGIRLFAQGLYPDLELE